MVVARTQRQTYGNHCLALCESGQPSVSVRPALATKMKESAMDGSSDNKGRGGGQWTTRLTMDKCWTVPPVGSLVAIAAATFWWHDYHIRPALCSSLRCAMADQKITHLHRVEEIIIKTLHRVATVARAADHAKVVIYRLHPPWRRTECLAGCTRAHGAVCIAVTLPIVVISDSDTACPLRLIASTGGRVDTNIYTMTRICWATVYGSLQPAFRRDVSISNSDPWISAHGVR